MLKDINKIRKELEGYDEVELPFDFPLGTHVKYISTQLSNKLASYIENKKKKKVKTSHIKDQMWIFINCIITNPSFTSQTKIELSSKTSNFGSKCDINDENIENHV